MKKSILKILLLLAFVSIVYAGVNEPAGEAEEPASEQAGENKRFEPADKFVPTEKLRADDAVAFPVDI